MMVRQTPAQAQAVVDFWRQAGPQRWFAKDDAFDADFRQRFIQDHHAAALGECAGWLDTTDGALALLLLLDQFPRNCFRDSAHAWATDGLALQYARQALAAGHDQVVEAPLRPFFYLPFEHAEDAEEQVRAVELFAALGDPETLKYALAHQKVIARFGRFPHRNASLGRSNTPDEQAWLDAGGGF